MDLGTHADSEPIRLCGRILNAIAANGIETKSVCSQTRPFKIEFKTDANEATATNTDASTSETNIFPGGIVGFSLNYVQRAC